jgi:hypothetical protein
MKNHIHSIGLDFNDLKQVDLLVKSFKNAALKISILVLSNAWHSPYIGISNVIDIIDIMHDITHNDSILLITNQASLEDYHITIFSYLGFSFEKIGLTSFIKNKFENYLLKNDYGMKDKLDVIKLGNAFIFNPHDL